MLIKIIIICLCIGIASPVRGASWPPLPFIIAGTLTVNGIRVTAETDEGYLIIVTDENQIPLSPAAEDRDGLRQEYETCNISIPIYHESSQPGGAVPGKTVIINVYRNGSKLLVTNPWGGKIVAGEPGGTAMIDIEAMTGPAVPADDDCSDLVEAERLKWDADNNHKIGLPEAIRALQVISGIRPNIE